MATLCYPPVFSHHIRVTALDDCCGLPDPEVECGQAVSEGMTSITLTSEIEDGVEITPRLTNGGICYSERGNDSFKRFTVGIDFCVVDPGVFSIVANAEPYLDYNDDVSGFTIAEGTLTKRFALEMWLGLAGTACEPGEEQAGAYVLLPCVGAGVLGDLDISGDSEITFSITGAFTRGGNVWGTGPYDVMLDAGTPAPLPTALDPLDHLLITRTGLAPPPAACGCFPIGS